jgi:hypothetical protein
MDGCLPLFIFFGKGILVAVTKQTKRGGGPPIAYKILLELFHRGLELDQRQKENKVGRFSPTPPGTSTSSVRPCPYADRQGHPEMPLSAVGKCRRNGTHPTCCVRRPHDSKRLWRHAFPLAGAHGGSHIHLCGRRNGIQCAGPWHDMTQHQKDLRVVSAAGTRLVPGLLRVPQLITFVGGQVKPPCQAATGSRWVWATGLGYVARVVLPLE